MTFAAPERHFIGLIVRKTRVLRIVRLYCTILKIALNHNNFCFFSPEKSFEKLSGLALIFCFTLFFKKRYGNQILNCFNKTKCALSDAFVFSIFSFLFLFVLFLYDLIKLNGYYAADSSCSCSCSFFA